MRKLILFFITALTFVACNESKRESVAPLKSTTNDTTVNNTLSAQQNLPQQMPANTTSALPLTTATMPQNVIASTTVAGTNPEHGQPGHRCEVNVGAPLNSTPVKTTVATSVIQPTTVSIPAKTTTAAKSVIQPTTVSQPAITTPIATQPAITKATTVTAKGMNPPHGEPGHRCDISVGAALNSPATTTKPTATIGSANIEPTAAPKQNSVIVPSLQNTSIITPATTPSTFTGKINPAHGQPGHDCKVAVGQPLP